MSKAEAVLARNEVIKPFSKDAITVEAHHLEIKQEHLNSEGIQPNGPGPTAAEWAAEPQAANDRTLPSVSHLREAVLKSSFTKMPNYMENYQGKQHPHLTLPIASWLAAAPLAACDALLLALLVPQLAWLT